MAWTTCARATNGAPQVFCYDGERDPRDCTSLRFVNQRTGRIEARRQDPLYPFKWTRIEAGACPEDATHVDLRW